MTSFKLLDGTSIPFLAYGNGTGDAQSQFQTTGSQALAAGFRHIDTAQGYGSEKQEAQTGELLKSTDVPLNEIYLTSKWSKTDGWKNPALLKNLKTSIRASVRKLHKPPNLFLIHSPLTPEDGSGDPKHLQAAWKQFEELKDEGVLQSIGVSNFRPQDLKAVLEIAKYKPVVNQLEYHPYVLTHLDPVLKIQEEHGILTESYGPLTPVLRNPEGPLTPVLERIAKRLSEETGRKVEPVHVLVLWTKAKGVVVVTASGNKERIQGLADTLSLPDLKPEEVEEIERVGRTVHYRYYTEHMERDFPTPDLPSK